MGTFYCANCTCFYLKPQRLCQVAIGDIIHWHVGGRSIPATIERLEGSNEPSQRFKVDRRLTDIQVRFVPNSISPVGKQDELSTQLVGMLRSMFNNATAFRTLRMPMVKSILIHGVSGVGKYTALRRGCHAMENCHLIEISVHDLLRLKDEFDNPEFINYNPLTLAVTRAIAGAPSILAIKNLDDIGIGASKSMADRVADLMRRQVSRIADEMKVCIVGFARELKDLPEGIKKSDVFGERLHIPIPSMFVNPDINRSAEYLYY
ncbi:hypothetical protein BX666DRAFT_359059 [Dichotomocladium elegans]|nr:hypothetical protein BX666DRAFT_359059 [Dichotomocladium elegans]